MKIVITAGGTREYIDPVRYISNASTGKMGYALAQAAVDAGHTVLLISAPTTLEKPNGAKRIDVEGSEEMFEAVKAAFDDADCLIMAAAVSDYRPKNKAPLKIKKTAKELVLTLEPTTDIIKWAGENKGNRIIVGFALEDANLLENAEKKMKAKNMDIIIANSPAAISADSSSVHIKAIGQDWQTLPVSKKSVTAQIIISRIEEFRKSDK